MLAGNARHGDWSARRRAVEDHLEPRGGRIERDGDRARIRPHGGRGRQAATIRGGGFELEIRSIAVGRPREGPAGARRVLIRMWMAAGPEGWAVPESDPPGHACPVNDAVFWIGDGGGEGDRIADDKTLRGRGLRNRE